MRFFSIDARPCRSLAAIPAALSFGHNEQHEHYDNRGSATVSLPSLMVQPGPSVAPAPSPRPCGAWRSTSGLHTGEVEFVAKDAAGIAVHTAARVAALAGPGDVFVSSTIKDLVAGSGLRFAERGTHALKGVPDEWRLFAVEH